MHSVVWLILYIITILILNLLKRHSRYLSLKFLIDIAMLYSGIESSGMTVPLICRSSVWWLWKSQSLLNPSTLEMKKSRFYFLHPFILSVDEKLASRYFLDVIRVIYHCCCLQKCIRFCLFTPQCQVLQSVEPIKHEEVVIGQYDGYKDDPTVPDESNTPTYASVVLRVHNERWEGKYYLMSYSKKKLAISRSSADFLN